MPTLTVPADYQALWTSDPRDQARTDGWTAASPDACLYHARSYLEFARAENGSGDLLWLARDGNPVLGLPLHPAGRRRVSTAYAGLLFAAGAGEGPIRRGLDALDALLAANPSLRIQILQCPLAPAYGDPGRMTMIARRLDERRATGPSLYSRLLALPGGAAGAEAEPLTTEDLLAADMGTYDASLRNQIRQGIRNGLSVQTVVPAGGEAIRAAYHDFTPLHRTSWERTGMQPHPETYWWALSQAIVDGGGRDVIVYVRDPAGAAVAAAVCHVQGARALYWAGCSSEEGLRTRANPLCLHAAIQACRQRGVRQFELGRFDAREASDKERSVTRYKSQFGGELVRVVGGELTAGASGALVGRLAGLAGRVRRSG